MKPTTEREEEGLVIETALVGEIVLLGKAKTGVWYTNQVDGVACAHPEVEGFVALVLQYADKKAQPEVFSREGLPKDYKEQITEATAKDFGDYIFALECNGERHHPTFDDDNDYTFDGATDVEAWVQCRFRLRTNYGRDTSDWLDGILTWPNSD